MSQQIKITIDGENIQVSQETTILDAALKAGIYIPHLCSHPDLPSLETTEGVHEVYQGIRVFNGSPRGEKPEDHEGCRLCVVQLGGESELIAACSTQVRSGMIISTESPEIKEHRQRRLAKILETHPHACLTCAQREGCAREPCSSNVPVEERCCPLLGNCELEEICDYIGIPDYTPRYVPQKTPVIDDEPLFIRNYELCIGCTRCVRVCNNLRGVNALGYTYVDGKRVIGSIATTLSESGCRYCTACVEVCPTGALQDRKLDPGKSREQSLVPCKYTCSLGTDVPQYIRFIQKEQYSDALAIILERTPFPSVLGRVCFHPCEQECRRGQLNEPIAICGLKRFITEMDQTPWEKKIQILPSTGKKVAVIGAGPTGLTTAYFLRKKGHEVVVYEAENEIGGLLRTALPSFRLPTKALERDLNIIKATGIDFRTGVKVGTDLSLSEILSDNYSAVFLGIGAQVSKKLNISGSDLADVYWGTDFLKKVKEGHPPQIGENVIVIGGGGVAIDAALSAFRLNAQSVQMACLESREEMPAHEWEIEEALEEHTSIHCSWGPKQILQQDGKVTGVELIRCTSVFNDKGEFSPKFDENTTQELKGDTVILAIGQTADLSAIDLPQTVEITSWNTVKINEGTMETTAPGIFAGGEVTSGPLSVVEAIDAGEKAAITIDKYLGGSGDIFVPLIELGTPNPHIGRIEGFAALSRSTMPKIPVNERVTNFDEIELGFDKKTAVNEAKRCLQCDLRLHISPIQLPPEKWLSFEEEEIMAVPQSSGVIQLLNENKEVFLIQGTMDLRSTLLDLFSSNDEAHFFIYEEDEMYTKRESELLQQFLQAHGSLPKGNESELDDDLF